MLNSSLDRLTAYASVRSRGGISVFSGRAVISEETVPEFLSTADDKLSAIDKLHERGFDVQRAGPLNVRISGSADLFERDMGVAFERREVDDSLSQSVSPLWAPTSETAGSLLDTGIPEVEGMAFPEPVMLNAASSTPPALRYHHLKVPQDVVSILNADPVHRDGYRGQGVRAAMIDSGFQWSHPYFASRPYDLEVALPMGSDSDTSGHGTGESANLLAIAPETNLYGLAMDDLIQAIQIARDDLGVQIISNSWSTRLDTDGPNGYWNPFWSLVQAEIALSVNQGIKVLFSGGNGGMSFTASMPETISVGGVYVDEQGEMQASDYASSFDSTRFPGQHVPEVCGLTGLQPKAIYIALPIPPGCEIDNRYSGMSFPDKDETGAGDGWGVFSGTSAACPMTAGAVALILSKYPGADLEEVRQRLYRAQDVTQGKSSMGELAGPGYDPATGYGLIDVEQACV